MQPDYNTYNYTNPTTEQRSPRKMLVTILGIFGLFIILLVIGSSLWSKYISKVSVTLKPSDGTTIAIGTAKDTEENPAIEKQIAKTSSELKVRIKPGDYLVVYTAPDKATQYKPITITKNETITSPKLEYTMGKLSSRLSTEKDNIHSALTTQLTTIQLSRYTYNYEALYHDGTWYAASLMPTDRLATTDPQMVVMQKQGAQWKLVAGPKIILHIGDYPSVPSDVIRDVDNRPIPNS